MKRLLIASLLGLLFLTACHIEKAHIPSWDIDLNVPLMNEKYLLSDLVDNEYIFIDDNDVLYLESSGDLETPDFGDVSFNIPLDIGPVPIVAGVPIDQSFPVVDQDQGYRLSYGRISTGAIEVRFSNVDPAVTQISLSFDGIYDPSNQPLTLSYGGNQEWQSYSLLGSHMGQFDSGAYLDEISIDLQIDSSLPVGTTAADLELRIPDRVRFDIFQGSLHSYVLESTGTAQSVNIDYPLGIDEAVTLQEASLVINVVNPVGFPARFEGEIYARNDSTGVEASVDILDDEGLPLLIQPGEPGSAVITELVLTNSISDLLEIMPHHIEIRNPKFTFGYTDPSIIGSVVSIQQLSGSYTINAPFTFILHPHTVSLDEPIELEISAENRERILNNAVNAGLRLQLINGLPIEADISILISDTLAIDLNDESTYLLRRDFTIASGLANPGYQELDLMLNEEEVNIFSNPLIYLQIALSLSTNGEVVTITASPADFIQIRGILSARVLVEDF